MKLRLMVNGEPAGYRVGATVAEVVAALTASPRGVAVAVNGVVLPRVDWGTTALRDGDRVEVLTASQGG